MGELNTLHPLARHAMELIGRPMREARRSIAEEAAGRVEAVEAARRDLCRRLGARPDDVPAAFALRLLHELRDTLAAERFTTTPLTSTEVELVGSAT